MDASCIEWRNGLHTVLRGRSSRYTEARRHPQQDAARWLLVSDLDSSLINKYSVLMQGDSAPREKSEDSKNKIRVVVELLLKRLLISLTSHPQMMSCCWSAGSSTELQPEFGTEGSRKFALRKKKKKYKGTTCHLTEKYDRILRGVSPCYFFMIHKTKCTTVHVCTHHFKSHQIKKKLKKTQPWEHSERKLAHCQSSKTSLLCFYHAGLFT